MRILKLYARFIPIYFKSKAEYGFAFYADFVGFTLAHIVNFTVIWLLLDRFKTINGWSVYEVLLIYTMNMFTYSLAAVFFFFQMREIEEMVHKGTFDGLLVKPVHPFIHMIIRTFGHFFVGDLIVAVIMFNICFRALDISMGFMNVLQFIFLLFGAVLIQASFIVLAGSTSFWFVKSTSITNMLLHNIRGFVNYPISIYHKAVRFVLTFLIPYAFVNFYPVQLLLDKDVKVFSPYLSYAVPFVGLALFAIAFLVWMKGVNKYQGQGADIAQQQALIDGINKIRWRRMKRRLK
jgi:ABC-2 type transport system permease protein